jgi:hypothetical protein
LTHRRPYARRMKLKKWFERLGCRNRIVARFGGAVLKKNPDGKWLLEGGSPGDRIAAREWISLFLHEAVLRNG